LTGGGCALRCVVARAANAVLADYAARTPVGRIGKPEDVADAAPSSSVTVS